MQQLSRPTVAAGLVVGVAAVSTAAVLARFAMGDDAGVSSAGPGDAPALAIAFWRTAIGAAVLAPLGWRAARRDRVRLDRAQHRKLALSGAALGLHFALFQGSLALTTVASAVTLATMSPIFVALGGWWFLREPTSRRTWVGMAITISGALTIGAADLRSVDLGPTALVGDAMAFASALAVTAYLLIGRVSRRRVPATTYSAVVYGWAAMVVLALCLASGTTLTGFDASTWWAILGIVLGPQLLGHSIFNALLSTIPATLVSIVVLAEPVGAGVLAWLLLGELPQGWFFVGAPLVLLGVLVATARREQPPGGVAGRSPRSSAPRKGSGQDGDDSASPAVS